MKPVAIVGLAAVMACPNDDVLPVVDQSEVPLALQTDTLCQALGWQTTCPIWEVRDDQALHDGNFGYGPLVNLIPSPALGTNTQATFDAGGPNGLLVAVAVVDTMTEREVSTRRSKGMGPAGLPPSYAAIGLQRGHNCLYLSHSGTNPATGWTAFTRLAAPGPDPCPANHGSTSPISVVTVQHPWFTNASDYPPVARFHEGSRASEVWIPQIGLRCGDRWCVVNGNSTFQTPPHAAGVPSDVNAATAGPWRNWLVPGWGDVQHVGDAPAAPGAGPTPRFNSALFHASFIPDTGLGNYTLARYSAGDWVHVGTIWLQNAPDAASKYHTKWKLKQGFNELFLTFDGAGTWSGRLIAGTDTVSMTVTREEHSDVVIPGVVRFRWSFLDEEGWVRCDVGCCKVRPT